MSSISISVIIPVYNGGESFRQCLESIKESNSPVEEVVVVSDGDTDGSRYLAQAYGAKVIRLPVQQGPANARNVGAAAASGQILFFVDADVALHPDTVSRVKARFQSEPELTALIGSYDDAPGAENFLSQYKNLFHHYTHQTSSENAFTFWGACGAIRRSTFHAVGGFDATWRNCVEDVELGYRLKQAGYSIRLCKEIQVKHLKHWKPVSLLKAEIFYRALPWTKLILQNQRLDTGLNLSPNNRMSVVLVFALIGTLMVSFALPQTLFIPILAMLGLLLINVDVYRFFYQKRGLLFMLKVIPWHWLYFLYGGATFAYGTVQYHLSKWSSAEPLLNR